jgi:hypothetical protein
MSTENPEPELEIKNLRPSSDDLIPDVHEAGATALGGGVASGHGGVAIGGDIYGEIIVGNYKVGRDITLTYDTAFERVVGSTNFVLKQLELSYQQTREQAQG